MKNVEKEFMLVFDLKEPTNVGSELISDRLLEQLLGRQRCYIKYYFGDEIFVFAEKNNEVYKIKVKINATSYGDVYKNIISMEKLEESHKIGDSIEFDAENLKYGIYLEQLLKNRE